VKSTINLLQSETSLGPTSFSSHAMCMHLVGTHPLQAMIPIFHPLMRHQLWPAQCSTVYCPPESTLFHRHALYCTNDPKVKSHNVLLVKKENERDRGTNPNLLTIP